MVDKRIGVGKVHVIEWLRPDDRRTGRELLDELQPLGIMSRPSVESELHSVSSHAEMLALLQKIDEDMQATGRVAMLHIETHGGPDGIGTADDDGLSWDEFRDALIPLNETSGLTLVVLIAACEGGWGMKMFHPAKRAACHTIIGPDREVFPHELFNGCVAFYRALFQSREGNTAFRAMNDAIDPSETTFASVPAEAAFKARYRNFRRDLCSEAMLAQRADDIVADVVDRIRRTTGIEMFSHEVADLRMNTMRRLADHHENFEEMRREYFFIDSQPENDERFPLTMEDCLREEG